MKKTNKNPYFLNTGHKLLNWYSLNARDLPFRKTKSPYHIWISEIIFQQTRIEQGKQHYLNFIEKFPDVETLSKASQDEVLLYWKGLGYYSRAINIHKAAKEITERFNGIFPHHYDDILSLKGVGKYTAAAISSICFNDKKPAVDGNFYRVLSRLFADNFDISSSHAFSYFSTLALEIMPEEHPGDFNQAMMDLGSEICKPKNPTCEFCPLREDCIAYNTGKVHLFPVKSKKLKVQELLMDYYFIHFENQFLIKQRDERFIWKKLFDFPEEISEELLDFMYSEQIIHHKLTHRNLKITIKKIKINSEILLQSLADNTGLEIVNFEDSQRKSFPKPLQNFLEKFYHSF